MVGDVGFEDVQVIVLLDSLDRPGGAETLAVEGATRLDPGLFTRTLCLSRWDDRFVTEEPARAILQRLRSADVRVLGLRRKHRFAIWAWLPLLRILRRERIDVLHAHLFGSNTWAVVIGRLTGVPVVIAHEHMWAYTGGGLRPLIDRWLIARFSDAFIAVSNEGRRRMIEIERIRPADLVLIRNGVPAQPSGDGEKLRAELGIPNDSPLIGSVGRLRPEKAFEVLIEAIAELAEERPDVRLAIAGDGPQREVLLRLSDRLGVADRVHLLGYRVDVPDLLAAFDVAVCCSDFEGGPLSIMEYMGARLPIIATNVGGIPELVHDGETGLLVDPREPTQLASALARLLENRDLAERLASAAYDLRNREYDIDVWAGRISDLYLKLLARKRRRSVRV